MSAVEAKSFGLGPIEAFKNAVTSADLALEDIKLIEINEAFAAQVIALSKELDIDTDRLNVNGGSVAMGHPTGMSGARLPLELLHALNDHKKQFGIAGICGNGGHGAAMVLERFSSN
jgi:acetyl-CoA C-acetyltransferase